MGNCLRKSDSKEIDAMNYHSKLNKINLEKEKKLEQMYHERNKNKSDIDEITKRTIKR